MPRNFIAPPNMPGWLRDIGQERRWRVQVQDPPIEAPKELYGFALKGETEGITARAKRQANLFWQEIIERLSTNDHGLYNYVEKSSDNIWAEGLRHILVLKDDEAVGWYDLDAGLVEFATLYDVGFVKQPKLVKKRKLWLMTESKWVAGDYPPEVGGKTTSKEALEANDSSDTASAKEANAAVCMGRAVEFDLKDGGTVIAPKRAGMLYDSSGVEWPSCSLLISSFSQGRQLDNSSSGVDYFGRNADVYAGDVATPVLDLSKWRRVGEVEAVFYSRAGTKAPGDFEHIFHRPRGLWRLIFPFKSASSKPVILYRLGKIYRLELPEGCMVDDRGLILP